MFWMTFFIIRAALNSCTPFINRTVRYALWATTSHYKCLSIKHWLRLTTSVRYTQSYITSMIQTDKLRMVTSDQVTKIAVTPLKPLYPKTQCYRQTWCLYLLYNRSYGRPKFTLREWEFSIFLLLWPWPWPDDLHIRNMILQRVQM